MVASGKLIRFDKADIELTQEQAWKVLRFVFDGDCNMRPGNLTDEDRSFAQALLIEALSSSRTMGWIEGLFTVVYMKPQAYGANTLTAAHKLMKLNLTRGLRSLDDDSSKIYRYVKEVLKWKWRSEFVQRQLTGEYTGY